MNVDLIGSALLLAGAAVNVGLGARRVPDRARRDPAHLPPAPRPATSNVRILPAAPFDWSRHPDA